MTVTNSVGDGMGQGVITGGNLYGGIYNGQRYTIPSTNAVWPPDQYQYVPYTYQTAEPAKTLRDILADDFAGFVVVPIDITFASGSERLRIGDLMSKLNNIPYIQLGNEIAVAQEVWHALLTYSKMGDDYAGLGLVEFLSQVLARK